MKRKIKKAAMLSLVTVVIAGCEGKKNDRAMPEVWQLRERSAGVFSDIRERLMDQAVSGADPADLSHWQEKSETAEGVETAEKPETAEGVEIAEKPETAKEIEEDPETVEVSEPAKDDPVSEAQGDYDGEPLTLPADVFGRTGDSQLSSRQQAAVNAGYGMVTMWDGSYVVMVHDGEDGWQMIEEYLNAIGLEGVGGGGGYINILEDQYMYYVNKVQPYAPDNSEVVWED